MMLSSKFTFSLIALAALLVSGSGFMAQDAYAWNAPEFTCNHINTTATHCTFDQSVNGTLSILDWAIKYTSTATAGSPLTDIAINDIIEYNGSAWVVSFDASEFELRAYVTNTYTLQQFKFENGEWSDTYQGIYEGGYWRLELLGTLPDAEIPSPNN